MQGTKATLRGSARAGTTATGMHTVGRVTGCATNARRRTWFTSFRLIHRFKALVLPRRSSCSKSSDTGVVVPVDGFCFVPEGLSDALLGIEVDLYIMVG